MTFKHLILLTSLMTFFVPATAKELKPVEPRPVYTPLTLQDLKGKQHNLSAYKGQVVLVNFWATWCPPCRAEMPSMQRLKDKMQGKPFSILAVDMAEPKEDIETFLKTMKDAKIDFTILLDKDGSELKKWKVFVFPTSYIIDPEGKIRYALLGSIEWDEPSIVQKIEALLPPVPQKSK